MSRAGRTAVTVDGTALRSLFQAVRSREAAAVSGVVALALTAWYTDLVARKKRSRYHGKAQSSKPQSSHNGGGSKDDGDEYGGDYGAEKLRVGKGRMSFQRLVKLLLRIVGRKVVVMLCFAVLRTMLSNRLSRLQGFLFRAAFLKKVPLFMRNMAENVLLCLASSAVEATAKRLLTDMELSWRGFLTSKLHSTYFSGMTYYQLNYVDKSISNPEQRICEDIPKLCSGLAELVGELCCAVVDATFYSVRLQSYTRTHAYTLALVAYVGTAGTLTTLLAPNFSKFYKKVQTLEGAYRQLQSRMRANAESIAFYGGGGGESLTIRDKFRELTNTRAALLRTQWRYGIVQDFFLKYLGATFAVLLIIGPFFGGHLQPSNDMMGRARMLAEMRYHTGVVISLFAALGTLAASSRKLARLKAFGDRFIAMHSKVEELTASQPSLPAAVAGSSRSEAAGTVVEAADEIGFEDAMVVTPSGSVLVRDLSLRVPLGTNLLVTGPNGAGKSSLFRVLGGLWPLASGKIHKPGGGSSGGGLSHEIFYVPQRPYVTLGTLHDQLVYPLVVAAGHEVVSEADIRKYLRMVDLEYLLDRPGGARAVVDWGDILSLGEQQRLGMARLFYHKPKFAILDECTSGVTMDMEHRFCMLVKEMGCTCITISHRPALVAFHDVVLALDGEGGWSILPPDAKPTIAATIMAATGNGAADNGGSAQQESLESWDTTVEDASTADNEAQHGTADHAQHAVPDIQRASSSSEACHAVLQESVRECSHHKDTLIARSPSSTVPSAEASSKAHAAAIAAIDHLQPSPQSSRERLKALAEVLMKGGRGVRLQMSAIAAVVMLRTLLQDRIAALNGRSVHFVLIQDRVAFARLIAQSVAQSAASAILAPSLKYVADTLALSWRKRLTDAILDKYLNGHCFYTVTNLARVADADQRISRDVERLTDDLSQLIPIMIKPAVDILWFSWRMSLLTGAKGLGMLYLYMLCGFTMLRTVTPNFGAMAGNQFRLESEFRALHQRLRLHAESVAFFGGGSREGRLVHARFNALLSHLHRVANVRWLHSVADDFLTKQLPNNATWALTLLYSLERTPSTIASPSQQGRIVHDMRYLASVVTNCFTAFGELLALNKHFAELMGGVVVVSDVLDTVQKCSGDHSGPWAVGPDGEITFSHHPEHQARARQARLFRQQQQEEASEDTPESSGGAMIVFNSTDVVTPRGLTLVRQLNFSVSSGTNVLVTGPNGSGKTSLFRVLRGLWPIFQGDVQTPRYRMELGRHSRRHCTIFYVPQKPYTAIGTLRDQVIYPLTLDQALEEVWGNVRRREAMRKLDERLNEIMEMVRLSYLVQRYAEGWEAAEQDWSEVLSLGEQQRLGMARLFYHRPHVAVLDECTNATSVDVEESLYERAAVLGITLVTITQRSALLKHHHAELRLTDGRGSWELHSLMLT